MFISRANNFEVGYLYLREFTTNEDAPNTYLVNLGWIPKIKKEEFVEYKGGKQIVGLLKRAEKNTMTKEQRKLEIDLEGIYHIDPSLLQSYSENVLNKNFYIGM